MVEIYRFLHDHPRVELGMYDDVESLCLALEMAIYVQIDSENRQRRISTQRFVPFDQAFAYEDMTTDVLNSMYDELVEIATGGGYKIHG